MRKLPNVVVKAPSTCVGHASTSTPCDVCGFYTEPRRVDDAKEREHNGKQHHERVDDVARRRPDQVVALVDVQSRAPTGSRRLCRPTTWLRVLISRSQAASVAVDHGGDAADRRRWVASFTVLLLARIPRLFRGKQLTSRCLATSGGLVFVDLSRSARLYCSCRLWQALG